MTSIYILIRWKTIPNIRNQPLHVTISTISAFYQSQKQKSKHFQPIKSSFPELSTAIDQYN